MSLIRCNEKCKWQKEGMCDRNDSHLTSEKISEVNNLVKNHNVNCIFFEAIENCRKKPCD